MHLKYQIFPSLSWLPFKTCPDTDLSAYQDVPESLDSEENKTLKEDRYHLDMSQACLPIEFLRVDVAGTRQVLSWARSPIRRAHGDCPPHSWVGPRLLSASDGCGRRGPPSLTSVHPPGPSQSGPRWRRGVRVAWPE